MESKEENTNQSVYSQVTDWLLNKLESSLNALYLVSSKRVETDLKEQNESAQGETSVEEAVESLSNSTDPKKQIVNDYFLVEKLDELENNKKLHENLKNTNEEFKNKKDKLLDEALESSNDKFKENFTKTLDNVRKNRAVLEEEGKTCKSIDSAAKLLDEMYNASASDKSFSYRA